MADNCKYVHAGSICRSICSTVLVIDTAKFSELFCPNPRSFAFQAVDPLQPPRADGAAADHDAVGPLGAAEGDLDRGRRRGQDEAGTKKKICRHRWFYFIATGPGETPKRDDLFRGELIGNSTF